MGKDNDRFHVGDVVGKLVIVQASGIDDITGEQDIWALCSCTMSDLFRTTRKKILGGKDACRLCLRARKVKESTKVNVQSDTIVGLASMQERIKYYPGVLGRKRSAQYGKLVARRIKSAPSKHPCEVCVYWDDDCAHIDCVLKGYPVIWRPAIEASYDGIRLTPDGAIPI